MRERTGGIRKESGGLAVPGEGDGVIAGWSEGELRAPTSLVELSSE
jgi:hypothetical protein